MKLETGSILLFNGDSITDCGRARPVGGAPYGLGSGYPSLVDGMLTSCCPEKRIRILNNAVSGDTIRQMAARWQEDTLAHEPDWVAVMIGINDVWRHFDIPFNLKPMVDFPEYVDTYRKLIEQTLPQVKGMILMAPYYVDKNEADPMTAMVRKYAAAVKDLAAEYHLVFCDVQAEFDEVQKKLHHMAFSADRVHPMNNIGHFIIAKAFLKSIDAWPLA